MNSPDGVLLETLPGRLSCRNNLVSDVFVESFGGFFLSGQISSFLKPRTLCRWAFGGLLLSSGEDVPPDNFFTATKSCRMSSSFTVTHCRRHGDSTTTVSDRRRVVITLMCPSIRQKHGTRHATRPDCVGQCCSCQPIVKYEVACHNSAAYRR